VAVTAPRTRTWLVAVVAAWALVLAGGIVWAVRRGGPTAREQTTVAQALPVVDRAVAEIATAAGSDRQAVVAVSGFDRAGDCSISVVRQGVRYHRVVTVLVPPGTELALLRRVAERLPASYQAVVFPLPVPKLKADAGFYVGLIGTVGEPGRVLFEADTGDCRPEGQLSGTGSEPAAAASPAADVVARLHVPVQLWRRHSIECPAGGTLSTVEAVGKPNELPDAIDAALGTMDGRVMATADLYGYRVAGTDVVVRVDGSRLVVSATTPCSGG
jgi:hypothetical protein